MSKPHQDRVSFLVAAYGAHTKNRFADLLAPLGIAPPHFGLLRWVSQVDGASQQEIADLMQVRRSVMVGLVDDVEAAGLVVRERHPRDRRAHALRLTPDGRRMLTRANRVADRLDEEILAALPVADREAFHDALRRMGAVTGLSSGVFPEVRGGMPHPIDA